MKYVVLFEDNPNAGADLRSQHMSTHLTFLERNASAINAAGPMFDGNGTGAGGIWIVDADSKALVQELVEQDPFWPTGLRQSVRILSWTQVFADGQRLISTG